MNNRKGIGYAVIVAGVALLVFVIGNCYQVATDAQYEVEKVREVVVENNKAIAVLEAEILTRLSRIEADIKEIKEKLDERWTKAER